MRRAIVAAVVVACGAGDGAGCGGTKAPETTYRAGSGVGSDESGSARVGGGRFARGQVEHAIRIETDALGLLDARLADADGKDDGKDPDAPVRRAAMHADRVAGAAFIAQLRACLTEPDDCPPSLDEPAISADFDLGTHELKGAFTAAASKWPAAAAAIEAAACGCRTAICIDWVMADLDRWETALPSAVQADETAATHVVGARECIWTRLGKKTIAPVSTDDEPDAAADR